MLLYRYQANGDSDITHLEIFGSMTNLDVSTYPLYRTRNNSVIEIEIGIWIDRLYLLSLIEISLVINK